MSYAHHCYHIIFSTKHREPLIRKSFQEDLYEYIGGIIRSKNGGLIEIGGMSDHIHILAKLHQSYAHAEVIRDLKSGSSRWVNEEKKCPGHFQWQIKYGSFSVSQSAVSKVQKYIRNQEEHHKKMDFKDEFRQFLNKHGYTPDEKYMWE